MPVGCAPGCSSIDRGGRWPFEGSVDKGPFSSYRRRENTYKVFDVNTFVKRVVENMKEKHKEYEKARFKFATRFEEKCDFIDEIVFPAVRACSTNPTPDNMRAMANSFKEGVEKFTTFGKMSGLAQVFEAAYFAMTEGSFNVIAKSAVFNMDDQTRSVVYGQTKKSETEKNSAMTNEAVVGVPMDRSN